MSQQAIDTACEGHLADPFSGSDEVEFCEGDCYLIPTEFTPHTAVMHRVAWAVSLVEALEREGAWVRNIARKGRTVTFEAGRSKVRPETDWSHWGDWAAKVGYYGSWDNPGTLDGRRCPPSF